jgi:proteasome regulatory subunit
MARDKAPAIIFIDEIDSVGSIRTHAGTPGSAEVNRTMMQLLAELDGFRARGDVKVIAATNRIDILDPALLRPGRFDRIIEIPMPNYDARLAILQIHVGKMKMSPAVDLKAIAHETEGASGADLKSIAVEAGMMAIRRLGSSVTAEDFKKAVDKVLGEEMLPRVDESMRMFS